MRNRRVSGPLPSYFNETFHSRDIDTRTTLDEGRENFREGNDLLKRCSASKCDYTIIHVFLFENLDNHSSLYLLRKDVARIIYITSFPVYLL